MFEALLDAKHNQRQIVVAWLDLCNAYGSVKHNLVQFALQWYHVPQSLCKLILWITTTRSVLASKNIGHRRFFVGLFQGCVLSCVLFSYVFQLLIDLLAP